MNIAQRAAGWSLIRFVAVRRLIFFKSGAKVVGIIDKDWYIFDDKGLDVPQLLKERTHLFKPGQRNFTKTVSHQGTIVVYPEADVLVPAATSHTIDNERLKLLSSKGITEFRDMSLLLKTSYLERFSDYDDHKMVLKMENKNSGLRGFIAIHNDNLGPALGGTRMFPYVTEEEALKDVLRLSRAMSYKCALAGLNYGGGKAVIIGEPKEDKNNVLLRDYAREVGKLDGRFYTGEDVGINKEDVQVAMLSEAPYFIGRKGQAEDPSPFAALSTFYAIQTVVENIFETDNLTNLKVAIKGVGKVGGELTRLLIQAGVEVVIADIDKTVVEKIKKEHQSVEVVDPVEIHTIDVDVYSPCALGDEFRDDNKEMIRARIICGAANNQLQSEEIGDWFFDHGILYIPDYLVNAGGLINVADELEPGGFQRERVMSRILKIKDKVKEIIHLSKKENRPSNRIANMWAEKIFNKQAVYDGG